MRLPPRGLVGGALFVGLALTLAACPGAPTTPQVAGGARGAGKGAAGCSGPHADACRRAQGMIASASAFSNVKHDYILDPTSTFAPGRGLEQGADGTWSAIPTACAQTKSGPRPAKLDTQTIDFGYVGVAVDNVLVAADADIMPFLAAGGSASVHKVKLVAIAFVRDLDPQFFDASDSVSFAAGCACGRATHFVGAVKVGGMLSYELDVRAGEAHGRALELVKAKIEASATDVTETRVGDLEVEGLEAQLRGGPMATAPLTFRVKNPVPIAYAVYPIADVCKFALPEPEVSPAPVDFGEVPYGKDATRLLHVVNRAAIDLTATLGPRTVDVPAHGSVDFPVTWIPRGETVGCESQIREETLVFTPKDPTTPAVPRQQSVRIVENVRTGRGGILRAEHVDTGEARAPDYAATVRDWTCPEDYVLVGCHAEHAQCSDAQKDCSQDFSLTANQVGNGCHIGCNGPHGYLSKSWCRFDAVMECRLRCTK
jgi:hypothetical protein